MKKWFEGMSTAWEVFWTFVIGCVTVIAGVILAITGLWVPLFVAFVLLVIGVIVRGIAGDFGSDADDCY